jgi:GMP synthase-like glutamine amidotransferase
MKTHILQHVHFEDIGSIQPWMENQQAEITYTRFFRNDCLPELKGLDLVIAMGGPMSVNDEGSFPWLRPEKQFIHNAVKRGTPILGICLGAQLVASAMGARVYRHAHKEIGWFDVTGTSSGEDVFPFPERCLAFHWHGETFDLPQGAIHLARSCGCENQAFQVGRRVVGLQFHLETTAESADSLIDNCRDELIPGPYVQPEKELRQIPASIYAQANSMMNNLLSYVAGVSR